MSNKDLPMDYDPNLVGQWGKQTVKLVFGQWKYRKTVLIDVTGNCTGFSVIDAAISNFYDNCGDFLELEDFDGNVLECGDDDDNGEDWLKSMLICAEIVAITAEH